MANKVGTLIKEARTKAGLSQAKLAEKITGLSAADISKAERGEKELTVSQLKEIAKATGVTQASLVNAAKEETGKTEAKKTEAKKTEAKKTEAKKTEAKKTETAKKTAEFKVTAAEKKLIELYRKADSDTKEAVQKLLKGQDEEEGQGGSIMDTLLENAIGLITGKK
ncbi:MAG: helix-turn-helix domain-containing protein [Oscillospiraceae bacterium]|nr:helix-turn-helix domain-containing protein [Oscillospiraceae bacterium]